MISSADRQRHQQSHKAEPQRQLHAPRLGRPEGGHREPDRHQDDHQPATGQRHGDTRVEPGLEVEMRRPPTPRLHGDQPDFDDTRRVEDAQQKAAEPRPEKRRRPHRGADRSPNDSPNVIGFRIDSGPSHVPPVTSSTTRCPSPLSNSRPPTTYPARSMVRIPPMLAGQRFRVVVSEARPGVRRATYPASNRHSPRRRPDKAVHPGTSPFSHAANGAAAASSTASRNWSRSRSRAAMMSESLTRTDNGSPADRIPKGTSPARVAPNASAATESTGESTGVPAARASCMERQFVGSTSTILRPPRTQQGPRGEPTTANRDHNRINIRRVSHNLRGDSRLPGHHILVVIRRQIHPRLFLRSFAASA